MMHENNADNPWNACVLNNTQQELRHLLPCHRNWILCPHPSVRLTYADVTLILTLGSMSEETNDTNTHLPTILDSLKVQEIINKAGVL